MFKFKSFKGLRYLPPFFVVAQLPSYAATPTTSISDEQQSLKQALQREAILGKSFFEQYYVDRVIPEAPTAQLVVAARIIATGTWLTPVSPETKAADAANATSTITADYGHYNPQR